MVALVIGPFVATPADAARTTRANYIGTRAATTAAPSCKQQGDNQCADHPDTGKKGIGHLKLLKKTRKTEPSRLGLRVGTAIEIHADTNALIRVTLAAILIA
jgi:hypothetical protein